MSTLEQIEAAILTLSPNEFQQLRKWLFDLDYERWDEQLEQNVADGKLSLFCHFPRLKNNKKRFSHRANRTRIDS